MRLLAASCAAALTALAGSPVLAQPYAPPSYGAPPYQPYAPPPPGYPQPPAPSAGSERLPNYAAQPGRGAPTPLTPPAYASPPYTPSPAYAPPPSYAPQQPGYAAPAPAYAPLPTYAPSGPAVGARPGHEPGVGPSYPYSPDASNIEEPSGNSRVAPRLPSLGLGGNGTPVQYLQAARGALATGRTGAAQQALEMAQTRLLDRSVAYGATNTPSSSPAVAQISDALHALANGDRSRTMQIIDATIPQVAASGQ